MRFAENYLTNGKSNHSHNPSFKSCMIRIPGSFNSKCHQGTNEVKIIRKWDRYRPPINLLIGSFHSYLVDQKIKEDKLGKRIEKKFGIKNSQINSMCWIEMLLKTPISDYRKNAVGLILAPYLINIRKCTFEMAIVLIKDWLQKCSDIRPIRYINDYKSQIFTYHFNQKNAVTNEIITTLKTKNKELYKRLSQKMRSTTK